MSARPRSADWQPAALSKQARPTPHENLRIRKTMARITKAQRESEDRLRDAFEAGSAHWATRRENDLTTVHRHASARYASKEEAFEFVEGFSAARRRHDDYLKEQAA